jgi:hypothetical protein
LKLGFSEYAFVHGDNEASNEQFKVTGIKKQKLQYKIPNSSYRTYTQPEKHKKRELPARSSLT